MFGVLQVEFVDLMCARFMCFYVLVWAQNEFMRTRGLPRPLRKRIRKYYSTFWSRGVYFSESDIVGELSFNIRRDLAHFMNEVRS